MELLDAIMQRRSIRKYNGAKVPREIIEQIIQAGTWAPSACNIQGWRFIVIDDEMYLKKIVQHGAAGFLESAHQAVLVLYDNRTDNTEYKDHIQSASACIQNMLLRAHELQVGACWVNFLPRKKVLKRLFSIPSFYEPVALVSIGYFDQTINERKRKQDAAECISYNQYGFTDDPFPVSSRSRLFFRRIARKIYFMLPSRRLANKKAGPFEKKFDN